MKFKVWLYVMTPDGEEFEFTAGELVRMFGWLLIWGVAQIYGVARFAALNYLVPVARMGAGIFQEVAVGTGSLLLWIIAFLWDIGRDVKSWFSGSRNRS
jgi:hypothetical protein